MPKNKVFINISIKTLIFFVCLYPCHILSEFFTLDKWGCYSDRVFTPTGLNEFIDHSYYSSLKQSKYDVWSQPKAPPHLDMLDGVLDGVYSFLPYRHPTKIIIIGKGIDEDHPEVQGKVSTCMYNYASTRIQNITLPGRAAILEHGTQIASLICGLTCGISKTTDIISITLGDKYHVSSKKVTEALDYLLEVSDLSYHELKIIVLSDYYYVKGGPFDTMVKRLREHNALFIAHASMEDHSLFSKDSDINDVFLFVSGIYKNGTRMGRSLLGDKAVDIFVYTEDIMVPYTNASFAPFGYGLRTHSDLSVGIIAGIAAYEWATDESIKRVSQLKSKLLGRTRHVKGGPKNVFVTF